MRRVVLSTLLLLLLMVPFLVGARPAGAQGNDCLRIGGDLVIRPGESCPGDAVSIGGNLFVQGTVGGNAVAVGGEVHVNGQVGGDVVSVGGGVYLEGKAVIGGDVTAVGGAIRRAPGAVVRGSILEGEVPFAGISTVEGRPAPPKWLAVALAALAAVLAFGLCLLLAAGLRALWPRRTQSMVATLRRSVWACLGIGLASTVLVAFGLVLLSVVLALTIIGIVLIPFLYLFALLLYAVGLAISGLALGEALLRRPEREPASPWLAGTVGLAILVPLVVFPAALLPCLGWLLSALLLSVGLGAMVLSRGGTVG